MKVGMGLRVIIGEESHVFSGVTCPRGLTFLLLRQKKSNKRKGDFLSNAPQIKKSSTLLRPALFSYLALVFCLSLSSIELVILVLLLFIIHSSYTYIYGKKSWQKIV